LEGEHRLRDGVRTTLRLPGETLHVLEESARPILRTPPFRGIRRRLNARRAWWRTHRERWIALGREEEKRGRYLAREPIQDEFDELVDFLANNPAILEIVQRQGAGLANTTVGEVRRRGMSADDWAEHLADAWRRRSSNNQPQPQAQPPTP